MTEIFSAEEAGRLMGISSSRVRKLLNEGRIQGVKKGRDWVVLKLGYDKRPVGRPKTKTEGK